MYVHFTALHQRSSRNMPIFLWMFSTTKPIPTSSSSSNGNGSHWTTEIDIDDHDFFSPWNKIANLYDFSTLFATLSLASRPRKLWSNSVLAKLRENSSIFFFWLFPKQEMNLSKKSYLSCVFFSVAEKRRHSKWENDWVWCVSLWDSLCSEREKCKLFVFECPRICQDNILIFLTVLLAHRKRGRDILNLSAFFYEFSLVECEWRKTNVKKWTFQNEHSCFEEFFSCVGFYVFFWVYFSVFLCVFVNGRHAIQPYCPQ